ncbi:MAG: archaeosortase/exosortase family protein [Crocinitomicaceae bacterium]|nr:archaeosortase/exosortase family protein [Crocinitomicaceae bacterium]
MIKRLFENPFARFLILSTAFYLVWHFTYEFYLRENTIIDEAVIDSLVSISQGILHFLGYELTTYHDVVWKNHIGIIGTNGVTVGASCDGIVLFALFIVFVLSFPGPWKHRLWFIPSGLLVIHLLNALRVSALVLIVYWNEAWLSFNHDYTFTIIVYSVVFALWWVWISKFSNISIQKKNTG